LCGSERVEKRNLEKKIVDVGQLLNIKRVIITLGTLRRILAFKLVLKLWKYNPLLFDLKTPNADLKLSFTNSTLIWQ